MGLATITMLAALYLLIEFKEDKSTKGRVMRGISATLLLIGTYQTITLVIEFFRLASSF